MLVVAQRQLRGEKQVFRQLQSCLRAAFGVTCKPVK